MQSFEFVSEMTQRPMLVWLENVVVWPDRLVCSWLPFLDNNVFQDILWNEKLKSYFFNYKLECCMILNTPNCYFMRSIKWAPRKKIQ